MPLVYDELRRIAASYVSRERKGQTLQPTALVNEVYVRLSAERTRHFQSRTHFLAIAALSMRQILIQRARARHAAKRVDGLQRVTLDDVAASFTGTGAPRDVDLLALDEALSRLAVQDPQQARIVELRYFGGLTIEETSEAVGVSPATIKREWAMARAWLKLALDGNAPPLRADDTREARA